MARKQNGTALNVEPGIGEVRRGILVHGIVQGVGFRPFVYRTAKALGLRGFIKNTSSGVSVEVQGSEDLIGKFLFEVQQHAPPLAKIHSFEVRPMIPVEEDGFSIELSLAGSEVETLISPDIALCVDCRRELADPENRRFQYPFINCTNCGPRFTIVEKIPYDRQYTSMKGFAMCPICDKEYHDPLDRRFHAQPTACRDCGPRIELRDASGQKVRCIDALAEAAALLKDGKILALKGVGGFHLAVDARNDAAVRLLRERKGREEKPFAVMMSDMELVRQFCDVEPEEASALLSPEAPIVLLVKRSMKGLSASIAPGNDRLGVMLPYSPLHSLLFDRGADVLLMTSANFSEEPILHENREAMERLGGIADAFLLHDRPIHIRCDDSVTIFLSGKLRQIRRSRGYVPAPVFLSGGGAPVMGTGGELKNTLCFLKGSKAILSQHIGDMKNYEAWQHFEQIFRHLQGIFQVSPELLVHDLHPGYMTTQWAAAQPLPMLGVQHHHAHLVSCLAENRTDGPAIGIVLDGTGYGTDGMIWGGEVLIGDASEAERFASLEPMPLPGGDAAITQPWRAALGYLFRSFSVLPELPFMSGKPAGLVLELLEKKLNTPETSSCGRLFDVVAALSGICDRITFEGQAAIALMQAAGGSIGREGFSFSFEENAGGLRILVAPLVREIADALGKGMSPGEVSRRFHRTLVDCFLEITLKASQQSGVKTVALSGGVFQNELLFEALIQELEHAGYRVLTHREVPTNDGGLCLGQAVIGRRFLEGRYRGVR
ncbi:MAG: carbamoyltransferase HypF [Chlorobium phaeobacteroides]|jgi:hydrogenase maturation protein HypF|nr:carbamoyltransferase HypF [Chlorobium phaeobacteroides]